MISQSELDLKSKINNDKKLDELCKNICLCIGWTIVICLIIYNIILYVNH